MKRSVSESGCIGAEPNANSIINYISIKHVPANATLLANSAKRVSQASLVLPWQNIQHKLAMPRTLRRLLHCPEH
jgi:hypothetical protein